MEYDHVDRTRRWHNSEWDLFPAQSAPATRRSDTGSNPSGSAAAPRSDTVTLSPQAQAIASLIGKGLVITNVTGELSRGEQPSGPISLYDSVSKSAFERLAATYGAGNQQADGIFSGMDSNGNGLISVFEILNAMRQTADSNNSLSQGLRQLMTAA
jgi:hypothetical protein